MKEVEDINILRFVIEHLRIEIKRLPEIGHGNFKTAVKSALPKIQETYPHIIDVRLEKPSSGFMFKIFEKNS